MKMGRLRARVFLLAVGSLVFTALFLSVLGIRFLKNELEYEFNLRQLAITRTFANVSSRSLRAGQMDFVQEFLDSLLADPDLEEAYLFDPQGKPLASKVRGRLPGDASALDLALFSQATRQFTPRIQIIREKGQSYRILYQRVWSETTNGFNTLGVAYLKFSYYRLTSQIKNLMRLFIIVTAVFIISALIFSYLFSRKLLKPIERLRNASIAVGKGDFAVSLPVETADEIGELAQSFNHMSKVLSETTVSKDYLGGILSNMIDPLIVMKTDGTIQMVNQATLDLLGYAKEELVNQSVHILFLSKEQSSTAAEQETLIMKGPVRNLELEFRKKSGEKVPALFSSSVTKNPDGVSTGVIAVAKDVTERKRLESIIRHSDKMSAVGQLASGVAHEINNPLGVIWGFAQGALRRIPAGDVLELPLKSIEREALRCKEIVQNLLSFSRVAKIEREPMKLNGAVEGAMSLVAAKAKMTQVKICKELSPDLPLMMGNSNQIQQVVINLAGNALDAMGGSGTLTIKTEFLKEDSRSSICLKVSDTGSGIPPDVLPHIFEPFFTTKPEGQGTGLGLALIHEIITKHGGTIDIDTHPGFTEFRIKFPVELSQESKSPLRSIPPSEAIGASMTARDVAERLG